MDIFILRHAIAVERGDPHYADDSRRPLTAAGRKKMAYSAAGMKTLGLFCDAILSSPYLRARQTAEIFTQVLGGKIHFTRHLVPGAPFQNLVEEINHDFKRCRSLLLVGHEPHLSELISFLLTSEKQILIELKKGGLCRLSLRKVSASSCATLHWLLTPAQLRLMASK